MNNELILFAASDERFLFGLASLVHSVRHHLDQSCVLNLYVYLDAVGRRQVRIFSSFCIDEMPNVRLHVVSHKDFSSGQIGVIEKLMCHRAYNWRVMLSRLFLPSLLPQRAQRAIYVDADAIALKDLAEVNTIPLDGAVVGAVKAPFSKMQRRLPSVPVYFNSGVLIVDLAKWRSEDIEKKCGEWLLADDPANAFADQDALNSVLCTDGRLHWKILSPVWNAIGVGSADRDKTEYPAPDLKDVKILHFAGSRKPWTTEVHPLGRYFRKHYEKTPFRIPADVRSPNAISGRMAAFLRKLLQARG